MHLVCYDIKLTKVDSCDLESMSMSLVCNPIPAFHQEAHTAKLVPWETIKIRISKRDILSST